MPASQPSPPPFTADDYAARMERVVTDAVEAGLDGGILVTPGPDLVWLTGYQPTAITERLTVLVLRPGPRADPPGTHCSNARTPRPRPAQPPSPSATGPTASDPYAVAGGLLDPAGTLRASPTRRGRCTCSACRTSLPGTRYRSMTQCLPMLRAVKDDNELARLAAAGRGGRRDVRRRSSGCASPVGARPRSRPTSPHCCVSSATSRSTSPSSGRARTAPTRTTRRANGSSRTVTPSSSTSAG